MTPAVPDGHDRARSQRSRFSVVIAGATAEQAADDRIVDLVVEGVRPGEVPIGNAGGGKIRRAVRNSNQIGRILRARQCLEAGTGDGDRLDLVR
jgi:hypothetical protein